MKSLFDQKHKDRDFILGDLVSKWDARKEDSRNHDKFDHLWCRPFKVTTAEGKNLFLLETLDRKILNAPINGRYLKNFMKLSVSKLSMYILVCFLSLIYGFSLFQ